MLPKAPMLRSGPICSHKSMGSLSCPLLLATWASNTQTFSSQLSLHTPFSQLMCLEVVPPISSLSFITRNLQMLSYISNHIQFQKLL